MTSSDAGARPAASPDEGLASSISALSELVMLDAALPATLTNIADFAVRAIPGADGAGLTLLQGDGPDTVVASAPFVREADSLQYTIGEGPCITATTHGRTVRSGSLGSDGAYPRFGPKVARLGLHSMLSLPLVSDGQVLGCINVYAHAPYAFDSRAAKLGELFAAPAAISVRNAQALSAAQQLAARLQLALAAQAARMLEEVSGRKAAEDDARAARQDTDEATAVKNEFLSRIGHELRTPLSHVLGFAQLLELESLSPSQQESLDQILRGGWRLSAMINAVFDITAADTDQA